MFHLDPRIRASDTTIETQALVQPTRSTTAPQVVEVQMQQTNGIQLHAKPANQTGGTVRLARKTRVDAVVAVEEKVRRITQAPMVGITTRVDIHHVVTRAVARDLQNAVEEVGKTGTTRPHLNPPLRVASAKAVARGNTIVILTVQIVIESARRRKKEKRRGKERRGVKLDRKEERVEMSTSLLFQQVQQLV